MSNKEFILSQVEWYKKSIGWTDREIKWLNGQLKRERQADKELLEYIYSKGPVTELEARCFPVKDYVGSETRKLLNDRAREYRRRKQYKARLAKYQKQAEAYV